MRYGSLCSGIGGLDRAIERVLRASPAWFCEADQHAASVLRRWWPHVPVLPDIKTQDWTQVEPVELVSAGYPCQPFSEAGQRRGVDDPRHLWPFVIIAIRVLRPRVVVLENVAGHLSLGFDVVLSDLAEAGFDAEWCVVPASAAGACHRRDRLFVVADAAHIGRERKRGARRGRDGSTDSREAPTHADSEGTRRTAQEQAGSQLGRGTEDDGMAAAWGDYGPAIERWANVVDRRPPAPVDGIGRLNVAFVEWMMGFPEGYVSPLPRTAALRCLGNSVVQQQGELAIAALSERADIRVDAAASSVRLIPHSSDTGNRL